MSSKTKKLLQMKIVSHSENAPTPKELWAREGPNGTKWMKTIAGYTVNDSKDDDDEPLHIAIIQLKKSVNRNGVRKHLARSRWNVIDILVEDLEAEVLELVKAKKTFVKGKFKIPSSDSEDSGEELVWDDDFEVIPMKKRDRDEMSADDEPKAKKPKTVQAKDPKLFNKKPTVDKIVKMIVKEQKKYDATQELEDIEDEEEIGEEFEEDD